MYLEV